ncbi:MAG: hypothetical protein WC662_00615 [Candidatus Paceibacterota bacterium]|jgi:hypothetical protein
MNEKEKPIFSIGDNGIEMNPKKGDSIITNADKIFMQNVKQNVDGGTIEHNATQNLTQIGNTMNAFNGGKIINKVESKEDSLKKNNSVVTKLAWHQVWWFKYIIFPLIVLLFGSFLIFQLGLNK